MLVTCVAALWGQQVQATSRIGYIGQTYFDNGGGPPPPVVQDCLYTAEVECSFCKYGDHFTWNTWGDMAQGCSQSSADDALENARATCRMICGRLISEQHPPGSVYVAANASGGTSVGAGTIEAVGPGVFVGHLPSGKEPLEPTTDLESLTHQLIEQTQNPWLWLSGPAEFFTSEGTLLQGSHVEAFWSGNGPPEPRMACSYEATSPCACEDAGLDSIRACSEESDTDLWTLAESSCPALCYQARSASWGAWGLLGVPREENTPRTPGATIQAVEPGIFVAHLPSSLEPLGPTNDWEGLTTKLEALTQGADVWLAGPAEYFVSTEAPPISSVPCTSAYTKYYYFDAALTQLAGQEKCVCGKLPEYSGRPTSFVALTEVQFCSVD
jgi:hypothetical protein